jgi:NAD(P)-dependent dehydrogenase (short-subunit alcohol dehydrogenase family)
MDMHLTGKIAVVTGASKGIGLAISQAFVAAGAYVVAGARHNSPELQALEAASSP